LKPPNTRKYLPTYTIRKVRVKARAMARVRKEKIKKSKVTPNPT
jgi:hypothetical protein